MDNKINVINECISKNISIIKNISDLSNVLKYDYKLFKSKNPSKSLKMIFKNINDNYGYIEQVDDKLNKLNKFNNIYFRESKKGRKTWIFK